MEIFINILIGILRKDNVKKTLIIIISVYAILILYSCQKNKAENQIQYVTESNQEENITFNSAANDQSQTPAPAPHQLSDTLYPEWIFLSENFRNRTKIYSPIDHDYNIKVVNQDFIGDTAYEFIKIWQDEMNYQYTQCINNIPEEYKEKFEKQQESWQKYIDNDVFPEIAQYGDGEILLGYGFVRESYLIYMDKIRTRTIEIMRIECFINGITVDFNYNSIED